MASRVAVITGGASGMGLASAQRLAAAGNKVASLDLDGDAATKAAAVLNESGAVAIGIAVDVSGDRPAVDAAMAKVRASQLGPIEIVVTSAGSTGSSRSPTSRPRRGRG